MKDIDPDKEFTTEEIDVPPYLSIFTSFGTLDVELPDGFADFSNKREVCPRFENSDAGIGVWINFRRIEDRNELIQDKPRFWVYRTRDEDGNVIDEKPGKIVFETDDWDEILAFMRPYLPA